MRLLLLLLTCVALVRTQESEEPAIPVYEITVHGNASYLYDPVPTKRVSVAPGDTLMIRCFAELEGFVEMEWAFDGREIHDSVIQEYRHDISVDGRTATLKIHSVTFDHLGHFECIVLKNDSDFSASAVRLHMVRDGPRERSNNPDLELCKKQKCYNGGTCFRHIHTDVSFCQCYPDYAGEYCEHYSPRVLLDPEPATECICRDSDAGLNPYIFYSGVVIFISLFSCTTALMIWKIVMQFRSSKRRLRKCDTLSSFHSSVHYDGSLFGSSHGYRNRLNTDASGFSGVRSDFKYNRVKPDLIRSVSSHHYDDTRSPGYDLAHGESKKIRNYIADALKGIESRLWRKEIVSECGIQTISQPSLTNSTLLNVEALLMSIDETGKTPTKAQLSSTWHDDLNTDANSAICDDVFSDLPTSPLLVSTAHSSHDFGPHKSHLKLSRAPRAFSRLSQKHSLSPTVSFCSDNSGFDGHYIDHKYIGQTGRPKFHLASISSTIDDSSECDQTVNAPFLGKGKALLATDTTNTMPEVIVTQDGEKQNIWAGNHTTRRASDGHVAENFSNLENTSSASQTFEKTRGSHLKMVPNMLSVHLETSLENETEEPIFRRKCSSFAYSDSLIQSLAVPSSPLQDSAYCSKTVSLDGFGTHCSEQDGQFTFSENLEPTIDTYCNNPFIKPDNENAGYPDIGPEDRYPLQAMWPKSAPIPALKQFRFSESNFENIDNDMCGKFSIQQRQQQHQQQKESQRTHQQEQPPLFESNILPAICNPANSLVQIQPTQTAVVGPTDGQFVAKPVFIDRSLISGVD